MWCVKRTHDARQHAAYFRHGLNVVAVSNVQDRASVTLLLAAMTDPMKLLSRCQTAYERFYCRVFLEKCLLRTYVCLRLKALVVIVDA